MRNKSCNLITNKLILNLNCKIRMKMKLFKFQILMINEVILSIKIILLFKKARRMVSKSMLIPNNKSRQKQKRIILSQIISNFED